MTKQADENTGEDHRCLIPPKAALEALVHHGGDSISDPDKTQGPAVPDRDKVIPFEQRQNPSVGAEGDDAGMSLAAKDDKDPAARGQGSKDLLLRETSPTGAPDDCECGAAAAARLYGRAPDKIHRYAIADGATAFYICRWVQPDGQTDELTLSWDRGVGWIFSAWVASRPLYRLDEIVANGQAQVVVCPSELAADAAAKFFPDCVVTCSSGAEREVAKSDWKSLAGHSITIWPNNNDVGRAFANEIATKLAAMNGAVSIIDATALAAINPAGGVRHPQESWGAVNALVDWADTENLRKALSGLAKTFEPPPAYVSYGAFEMTSAGLYATVENGSGKNRVAEKIWVSDPFEIMGASRDPEGQGWGKELRLHDADGREHRLYIADAALHRHATQVCQSLAHVGLQVNGDARPQLAEYLAGARVKGRVTRVTRTGWHEIGGNKIFVLPNKIIGPNGAEIVTLDAAAHGAYEASGTLQEWRDGAATLSSGHVLPVLAISTALAGPLLAYTGAEGGGVHFYGPSSKGKTTIAILAASVWGRGGYPGYMRSWLATANGLEGAASGATDTALILDELGQAEASAAGAMLYGLANGAGKARANSRGELIKPRSWRLMVVSTGELPTETKLGEDRRRTPRAGQMVRMLNISVDREFGAFDHGGSDGDAAKLARQCQQASTSAYGVAGPEFVRKLIDSGLTGKVVQEAIAAFVRDHVPPKSDGQIDRAAQRLGLIAVAGELATLFGLTPWSQGEAVTATAWALAEWIARRGGIEPAEVLDAIEQARAFIASSAARFEDLDDLDGEPVRNRAGWRKGGEWWVLPKVWRTEVFDGLDPVVVARVLAERGMLRRQSGDNLQCTVNVGGAKRTRAYVLTAALLDSDAPAD